MGEEDPGVHREGSVSFAREGSEGGLCDCPVQVSGILITDVIANRMYLVLVFHVRGSRHVLKRLFGTQLST